MNNQNLTELAVKAVSSRKALNKLFDNIYPIVWHFYKIRLNDEEEAKDLTQNACIKIVKNLGNYDKNKAGFTTWMFRIIKNLLIDFFRKKSIPMEEINFNILESSDSPVNKIIKQEEGSKIKMAFEKLGTRQKEVLEMKYFFYMRNNEIAAALEIKEKTVSSILCRAFEKLKEILKDDFDGN